MQLPARPAADVVLRVDGGGEEGALAGRRVGPDLDGPAVHAVPALAVDVAAGDAPEEDVDEAEEALVAVAAGRRPPLGRLRMVDGQVEGAPRKLPSLENESLYVVLRRICTRRR